MVKKTYFVEGFDCPHCTAATEKFLSNVEDIESASIDFANKVMTIEYKEKAYSIFHLKRVIKQVETNRIKIKEIK